MGENSVVEVLIDMYNLSNLPEEEREAFVQRMIKTHKLEDDDDKNAVYQKMLGKVPNLFPSSSSKTSTLVKFYDFLIRDDKYNIVKSAQDPAGPANHPTLTPSLHPDIVAKLTQQGRQNLYAHQVKSIELARQGKNVLITTPTASGKSYGYVLPYLESVKVDPNARGLFIFPMNALTNDQYDKLVDFGIGTVQKYDGTIPSHEKKKIRSNPPNALLTNPDQIHHSILRTHAEWTDFFKNLKFIVIDEIHNYKGFFGSNVSNILFRLLHAVKKAGGDPQIICTSATIANAKQFAKKLAWVDFEEVRFSGAGKPEKYYLMLHSINPRELENLSEMSEPEEQVLKELFESNPGRVLSELVLSLCSHDFQSMVFVNSRLMADQLRDYAIHEAGKYPKVKSDMICSYHAGLSSTERQEIETGIKAGCKKIIFTTSALELGIDIGSLDVCVLFGLPKTSNEIWQRIGRVGRDPSKPALAVVVNTFTADDRYYFLNPDRFFETKHEPEEPIIFPENEEIRKLHLQCGYHEGLELQDIDDKHLWGFVDPKKKIESAYPTIPIRNSWHDPFTLENENATEIGSLEYERVYRELHPGAIFRAANKNYRVRRVDKKARKAQLIEAKDLKYYTVPDVKTLIKIGPNSVEEILSFGELPLLIGWGDLETTLTVPKFYRIYPNEQFPRRSKLRHNSERKFKTKGFWLTIPPHMEKHWTHVLPGFTGDHSFNVLHSLEHLLSRVISDRGYCDSSDIVSLTESGHHYSRNHTVFFYDNYHKGMGISERIYYNIEDLLQRAHIRISNCGCADGCPSCIIKNSYCEHHEKFTDKEGTQIFLNAFISKPSKRAKYIDRSNSLEKFSVHSEDQFKVGDEYSPGWIVNEKTEDEYVLKNDSGGFAFVPYEDSPL